MASAVLVIGPAWVGDMVMAQSLFRLLRQREPRVAIDVVAPAWSAPLLDRMPEVRRAIVLDIPHGRLALGARRALGRELRAGGYARAIIVPRSAKSALVPFFARIPVRTGFRAELRSVLLTDPRTLDRRRLPQTVQRLLALGLPPGSPLPDPVPMPALAVDVANRAALRRALQLPADVPAVALLPGAAYGPAKRWPTTHFGALARQLLARGLQVWVLGSAGERALGEEIAAAGGAGVRNLCGEGDLADAADLLSLARVAVTNDSGLMHVAAAAGTHVVALYGSSSPEMTPPLTERRTVLSLRLDCSPCHERECPLGHLKCLRDLSPERVLEALVPALVGGVA